MEENYIEETSKKKSFLREIFDIVIIFVFMYLIFTFVLMSVRIDGESMEPNYHNGERGIMLRSLPGQINNPDYQDVVVVEYNDNGIDELIVKRVIARPRDTIAIINNEIYVNGDVVNDVMRDPETMMEDLEDLKLADDEYFVLGDNRNNSKDSRIIGPVKRDQIKAINGFMFWPLSEFGFME